MRLPLFSASISLGHLARPSPIDLTQIEMSRTEQEERLEAMFAALETAFRKLDKTRDESKRQAMLKDITSQLRDGKT